jgi:hypothetical protein
MRKACNFEFTCFQVATTATSSQIELIFASYRLKHAANRERGWYPRLERVYRAAGPLLRELFVSATPPKIKAIAAIMARDGVSPSQPTPPTAVMTGTSN